MAITNFLDYVTYPNEDQREQILTDYFDTQKLQLDLTQYLTLNNLTEKITTNAFDSRGLFYTVNKDLRENVRRYNNDVFYLTDALFRMVHYYHLMTDSTTRDETLIYEVLFRRSARCVCSEIFMYEEKIKNLLRVLLRFNKKKTQKYDDFKEELKRHTKNNIHIKRFLKSLNKYENSSYVRFIKKTRNDEIHNDSVIDKYTDVQTLAKGVTAHCSVHYIIRNETLFSNIQQALQQQVILKNSLQTVLDNHKIQPKKAM